MPLFQQAVLRKYNNELDKEKLSAAWKNFQSHFGNPAVQAHIRQLKEEQYQEGFLRDLFVTVFGYTLNPQPGFNLTTEYKNEKDSKKADGAILKGDAVRAVIELKGTDTTDLSKIETQAFGYLHNQKGCTYVITSNFEKLRFYIQDATEHIEFNLFALGREEFETLYLCLQAESLLADVPLQVAQQSVTQEDAVTKKLYADYSSFKQALFQNLAALNPQYDKLELFKKTQKLLDRFLFILFAEDRLLLPPNFIVKIVEEHRQVQKLRLQQSLYERFKVYFNDLLTGNKDEDIFAYNGGLFEPDAVLDNLTIADDVLQQGILKLSNYDYNTEVDVNILGHIFEHSLNEMEALQASLQNAAVDKTKTRRKKEGVFYTPRYITRYIVENTVGALCREKKEALQIVEEDYAPAVKKTKASEAGRKVLVQKLDDYRAWLLRLTICDPACGSGAFLNAALEFLIAEHNYIDELTNKLMGASIGFTWTPNDILEHNLFGVDINEEAVEIARLSLWLRTAQRGRKLSNLSGNIKAGNSLIDDKAVAGEKAFVWKEEFREVFEKGGFDVVIGNPPYVLIQPNNTSEKILNYYRRAFAFADFKIDLFHLFFQLGIRILKPDCRLGYITPSTLLYNFYAENLRGWINDKTEIEKISISETMIFQDADVHTAVYFLKKKEQNDKNNFVKFTVELEKVLNSSAQYNKIKQSDIDDTPGKVWNLLVNEHNIDLLRKIGQYKKLKELVQINRGLITGDRTKYFSNDKTTEKHIPILTGSDVGRYWSVPPTEYVLFERPKTAGGCWDKEVHLSLHKICIRQIGFEPIATFIDDQYAITGNIFSIISGNKIDEKYYLAIINSKLIKYYWQIMFNDFKTAFPQVTLFNISQIPIPATVLEEKKNIVGIVDFMLSRNKELHTMKQSLLQFLQAKQESITISKKLADWPSLTFKEFLKELEKQKVKLSLPEQAEWLTYFEAEKKKAAALQTLISQTDKEIDQMVYALYGLTEEEIKIVESS